ncbi:FGGY-family carbohydrate kinase [Oceaniglobus indicus]|uniref:FGGY-family carbohydrate kinase n=1 Tax=Oceaniglobus indicus TaxID=2047749 RepID=UPI000C191FCE|nr:FGGY-family carbohydrate kinase [Oceaniglobus indicus]
MAEAGPYLLGLDAGNTVIKAVLFDLTGRQIAMHGLDGQSASPAPGHVERDLNELWRNAGQAIRGCIDKAGIAPGDIAAIGCAGHGNGLYLLDREGAPLIGIQSLDSRASDLAADLKARHGDALFDICLQAPWPSQTPVLLAWIKAHRPDLYERAGTALMCKDFIGFRLTGNRFADTSDMSGAGLTALPSGEYDADLMALYGLDDAMHLLPDLLDPAQIAGHVTESAARETGLVAGIPVVAGFFDVVSSALGAGAGSPGDASVIVGSWGINQVFVTEPSRNRDVFMASRFGEGRFIEIESSATSAANLEWYVREFVERGAHHDDPFGQCNEAVGAITPRVDDPIYHPFLYGARLNATARAGFYGIAGWHGEGHILRALFEGVAFEHRRHIEVLKASGAAFDRAILSGGGARSPHWPQIFADVLGIPVTTAEAQETGALGAAIGAGIGAGLFDSYETGVSAMTRKGAEFRPDTAMRDHYDRRYRLFTELTRRMADLWKDMA